ncbi:hypothetical protein C2845_PM08G07410 [Panicum miliaceum]|uniref:Uncharacterized protein n=1 Tax=Panicum miliaceum TaxID=4540 RepID=A0A3L6R074_PANMI|nr:hypothetical protein C2845_PM08G07410 [Panicum miliaceum]
MHHDAISTSARDEPPRARTCAPPPGHTATRSRSRASRSTQAPPSPPLHLLVQLAPLYQPLFPAISYPGAKQPHGRPQTPPPPPPADPWCPPPSIASWRLMEPVAAPLCRPIVATRRRHLTDPGASPPVHADIDDEGATTSAASRPRAAPRRVSLRERRCGRRAPLPAQHRRRATRSARFGLAAAILASCAGLRRLAPAAAGRGRKGGGGSRPCEERRRGPKHMRINEFRSFVFRLLSCNLHSIELVVLTFTLHNTRCSISNVCIYNAYQADIILLRSFHCLLHCHKEFNHASDAQ